MPGEVTKSLEEELDEIDAVGDIYEEESDDTTGDSDQDTDNVSSDADNQNGENEQDIVKTGEESDGEKKDSKKESAGKEASEETDTSGKAESDEKKESEAESEASKDLDGQQRIVSLMAEIDRLSGLLVTQVPTVKLDSPDTKPKLDTSEVKLPEVEDFIGDLDMDDVASSPKILNEILNKVLQKGIETGKELSTKQVISPTVDTSQTIASQIEGAIAVKGMIDKFYDANPELSNVKQVVKACAAHIIQESPDKRLDDILNLAADAARKTLGIKKNTKKTDIATSDEVAFAKQKGGQRKKSKKDSKLQQEIDEL